MKAAILAGGLGKRLRPLTDDRPKPMIEVSGMPILGWQISWLSSHGITDIVLCTGYMREMIINYIGSGAKFGVKVGYVVEEVPLGTAGALKNAENLLVNEGPILVMNGDILTDLDPSKLISEVKGDIMGAISVVPLRSPYGIVGLRSNGSIEGFREKPVLEDYWINAGVYCLSSSVFERLPQTGNLESDLFPSLATEEHLTAIKYYDVKWRSIDSHKDVEEAQKEFPKH